MEAAGGAEHLLPLAHQAGQPEYRAGGYGQAAGQGRDAALERLDTGLAARSTARRDSEVAFEPLAQSRSGHAQDHIDSVGLGFTLGSDYHADLAQFRA